MVFCNNCGKELKPGTKFCDDCGYPVMNAEEGNAPKTEQAHPQSAPAPEPKREPKREYVDEPAFAPAAAPTVPEENRPLGPWAYFGYSLLFSIPVIGFICLIIFSFAGRNVNRKNFARSYWCRFFLVLALVLIFIVILLTGVLRGAFDGFGSWLSSIGLDWLAKLFA